VVLPNNDVSVISTATNPCGNDPGGAFPDRRGLHTQRGLCLVVNQNSDNVSVIDTATRTVMARSMWETTLGCWLFPPAEHFAYVTNKSSNSSGTITATNSVVTNVPVATDPTAYHHPDGARICDQLLSKQLSSISTATTRLAIRLAVQTYPIAFPNHSKRCLRLCGDNGQGSNSVSVINTAQVMWWHAK